MGSWAELDARYPPEALTPASALMVALCHLEGLLSIYGGDGSLADCLPRHGLFYDQELLVRAESYLQNTPPDRFLEQARALLNPEQKLCLLLNLIDHALSRGLRLDKHPALLATIEGLGASLEQLRPYISTLAIKNDLSLFPQ
jgi:hypothetical protein